MMAHGAPSSKSSTQGIPCPIRTACYPRHQAATKTPLHFPIIVYWPDSKTTKKMETRQNSNRIRYNRGNREPLGKRWPWLECSVGQSHGEGAHAMPVHSRECSHHTWSVGRRHGDLSRFVRADKLKTRKNNNAHTLLIALYKEHNPVSDTATPVSRGGGRALLSLPTLMAQPRINPASLAASSLSLALGHNTTQKSWVITTANSEWGTARTQPPLHRRDTNYCGIPRSRTHHDYVGGSLRVRSRDCASQPLHPPSVASF